MFYCHSLILPPFTFSLAASLSLPPSLPPSSPSNGLYTVLMMVDEVGRSAVVSMVPLTGATSLTAASEQVATSLSGTSG